MKHIKTKNKYTTSNNELDLNNMTATSYEWWTYFKVIRGKKVFNEYPYSVSTKKHQREVLVKLEELGIHIDHKVYTKRSLSAFKTLKEVKIDSIQTRIDDLERKKSQLIGKVTPKVVA